MIKCVPAILTCWMVILTGTGCTSTRSVIVRVDPPDAQIRVDGQPPGPVPKTPLQFTFNTPYETHRISASRLGYRTDPPETLTRDDGRTEIFIKLKPERWAVNIFVEPVPAVVSIDGKQISNGEVSAISHDMEFGVDPKSNEPIVREITATHENWQPASVKVDRGASSFTFTLQLKPMSRNITVNTKPQGAEILLDGTKIGTSPLKDFPVEFPYSSVLKNFPSRDLIAKLPGYDDRQQEVDYNSISPEYTFDFAARRKQIRITTEPDDAKVVIDGAEVPIDASGKAVTSREFPPINPAGELKTYTATISKKTEDSEWETKTLSIGWDGGEQNYKVALTEIRTRPVQMLIHNVRKTENAWDVSPEWVTTQASKDMTEPAGKPAAQKVHALAKGFQLGSLALSPDGTQLLFTTMTAGDDRSNFRSQICIVRSDGAAERQTITDGNSVDIMPAFTPDGEQVVFSSNRGGRRFNIWRVSLKGSGRPTQLTNSDANDLWPMIDSDPRPRLFYQTMIDTRMDPRIYMVQLGTSFPTDLIMGTQPRVSPKNDAILFSIGSERSINRDIFGVADAGGASENLTNTPDSDECDVSWSKDGSKAVFASDRGVDERGRRNYDIWMMDLARPEKPVQITFNGSRDDCPVFDRTGSNIYFRSNRGGEWAIWKIPVPR